MQTTTKLSGTLRIMTGLLLLGLPLWAGYVARKPIIIIYIAIAFSISFIAGRFGRWVDAAPDTTVSTFILGLLSTVIVQLILVGMLYLIGYGAGALFEPTQSPSSVSEADLFLLAGFSIVGALAGLFIMFLERR